MKIRITGASGFIGKKLVQSMLILVMKSNSFIKHNHKKINHNKNKVIYLDDISKIKDWSKLLRG